MPSVEIPRTSRVERKASGTPSGELALIMFAHRGATQRPKACMQRLKRSGLWNEAPPVRPHLNCRSTSRHDGETCGNNTGGITVIFPIQSSCPGAHDTGYFTQPLAPCGKSGYGNEAGGACVRLWVLDISKNREMSRMPPHRIAAEFLPLLDHRMAYLTCAMLLRRFDRQQFAPLLDLHRTPMLSAGYG